MEADSVNVASGLFKNFLRKAEECHTGMNAALLKFVDSNPSSKKSSYFRYIMKLKLSTAIVISTFVLLSAYPISKFIFYKEALFIPLIIGSIYILLLSAERDRKSVV